MPHAFTAVCTILAATGIASASASTSDAAAASRTPAPSERAALTPVDLVSPIADALASVPDDVRAFDMHISTLANPFMQGRVPGSQGSEFTKAYLEFYFRKAGLTRPFAIDEADGDAADTTSSYRQPFELRGRAEVLTQAMAATSADGGRVGRLIPGDDFNATGLGLGGAVQGQAVFVGYSTVTEEYDAYAPDPDLDLTGMVAIMLRFEPMNAEGRSKFTGGQWSGAASFNNKLRAVAQRNPAAVIIINPPSTADPRAGRVLPAGGGGRAVLDVPVIHMSADAGERLIAALDADGRSLETFQRLADAEPHIHALGGEIKLYADLERTTLVPENVAGLLPGKGDLADEYIVIGGHFDHTGNGGFGTPQTLAQIHEGADDNASGTAGVLLLADRLSKTYAALPEEADARSVLFIGFDAEESGLNGAYHYVANPIAPIEDHVLMLNMDMIGRVVDGGLSLQGATSAEGFEEWLQPFMDASPLNFVVSQSVGRRSDHAPFYFDGNIPVLFGIINPLHNDYHTAGDEAWKINRVGSVQVIDFFENVATAMALQPERLQYAAPTPQTATPRSRVIVGVQPQDTAEAGVLLARVMPNTAASEGGLVTGDRIIEWDGQEVTSLSDWLQLLAEHEPDDVVDVTVMREEERVETRLTLRAR
ncbi:MAG: M28 family peptidase [Planctomycetota bacterium]